MATNYLKLADYQIAAEVARALSEDLQMSSDWTANLIAQSQQASAIIMTKQDMLVCGQAWADWAFKLCDEKAQINWQVAEGQQVVAGTHLCTVSASARGLLTAERSALNFLQTLSATATLTRQYCDLLSDCKVQIMDTRKTIPGLRLSQKYAVRMAGGYNQRIGLFDGVLIKENHIIAHGGIKQVLDHAFATTPPAIAIQIEVESLDELIEAVAAGAKLILLDNMSLVQIRQAVSYCHRVAQHQGKIALEVSGNVNLATVRDYALTGVDRISIGGLTKNIQAIDLSMRFI